MGVSFIVCAICRVLETALKHMISYYSHLYMKLRDKMFPEKQITQASYSTILHNHVCDGPKNCVLYVLPNAGIFFFLPPPQSTFKNRAAELKSRTCYQMLIHHLQVLPHKSKLQATLGAIRAAPLPQTPLITQ